jgi:hypothetical protein
LDEAEDMSNQNKLWMLIAGSMKATPRMEQYAVSATKRAMEKRHFVVVGDNPQGIDRIVIQTLIDASYSDWAVTSIPTEYPRALVAIETGKPVPSMNSFEDYHERDVTMCDMVDEGMFIWDGKSKGTLAGFMYMEGQNQTAYLADFSKMQSSGQPTLTVHKQVAELPVPVAKVEAFRQKKLW